MCRLKKHNSCCLRTVGITAQSKRTDPTPLMTNGRSLAGQRQRQAGGSCSLHPPPPPPPLLPFVSLPVTVCLFVCLFVYLVGWLCLFAVYLQRLSLSPSRTPQEDVSSGGGGGDGDRRRSRCRAKNLVAKSPRKKRYGGHRLGVKLVGWM